MSTTTETIQRTTPPLRLPAAAKAMGISADTLRKLSRRGQVRHIQLAARRWLIPAWVVDAWINGRTTK